MRPEEPVTRMDLTMGKMKRLDIAAGQRVASRNWSGMRLAIGFGRGVMGNMKLPFGLSAARSLVGRLMLHALLMVTSVRLAAVERRLEIASPAAVAAGEEVQVTISARTDAGQGERVGFLQVEATTDGGKTWTAVCYLNNVGATVVQQARVRAGAAGGTVRLRARVAFRDGLAGDVDYRGAAIRWHESWGDWREPPAKYAAIAVKDR